MPCTETSARLPSPLKVFGQGDAPRVELWYGDELHIGRSGRPNRWVTLPGRVHALAGLHDLRWQLRNQPGTGGPLSVGPTAYRLADVGDFNLEFDPAMLRIGRNELTLVAVGRDGRQTTVELAVVLHAEERVPLPTHVDFAALRRIDDAVQVLDGRWEQERDGLRTRQVGYDRMLCVGDSTWRDVDVRLCFTVHAYPDDPMLAELPNCGSLVGVMLRWYGHTNWHDLVPYRGYRPFGIMAMHGHAFSGATRFGLYKNDDVLYPHAAPHQPLDLGRRQWLRVDARSRPNAPSVYRLKAWPDDQPEPETWMFTEVGPDDERQQGAVALIAHQVDATFHQIRLKPSEPVTTIH